MVWPGDETWDDAREAWNLAVDQHPAAVVLPESVTEVLAAVRWARRYGLRIAAQGTGHGAATLGALEDTLLLRTDRLRGVEIDPKRRIARVASGTVWQEVADAAADYGLAGLAGSGPDVGVVGYTLGGGLSFLSRRYGLAASSVEAIELVTAEGRAVRTDEHHEPALFWALRGGGGSFGIVTALEFRLYPLVEAYAGSLFWPIDQAREVLRVWRKLTATAPNELTLIARLLDVPQQPDIPGQLRGRSFVVVEAIHAGSRTEAEPLLAPLRALEPELDLVRPIPASSLGRIHMDPEHPVPSVGDGFLLTDLPEEAIGTILAAAGPGTESPLLSLEVRQLGGAIASAPPGHGALGSIKAPFAVYGAGVARSPDQAGVVDERLKLIRQALAPWVANRDFLNFTGRPVHGARLFGPDTHRWLQGVKAVYDPTDLIRSNQPITPCWPHY
jgi:FAD binding domain